MSDLPFSRSRTRMNEWLTIFDNKFISRQQHIELDLVSFAVKLEFSNFLSAPTVSHIEHNIHFRYPLAELSHPIIGG